MGVAFISLTEALDLTTIAARLRQSAVPPRPNRLMPLPCSKPMTS